MSQEHKDSEAYQSYLLGFTKFIYLLILITVIASLCVCDCTIWGLYHLGVPAIADCRLPSIQVFFILVIQL